MRVFSELFEEKAVLSNWFCISSLPSPVLENKCLLAASGIERVGELFFSYEKTLEFFDIYRTDPVIKDLYNLAM